MSVLDASAILAFIQNEPGADLVESALDDGAVIGAANWSEVLQKVGTNLGARAAIAVLESYGVTIEAVSRRDAEVAAALWHPGSSLSLAGRLCLALGVRLDTEIFTADSAWGTDGNIHQIR